MVSEDFRANFYLYNIDLNNMVKYMVFIAVLFTLPVSQMKSNVAKSNLA